MVIHWCWGSSNLNGSLVLIELLRALLYVLMNVVYGYIFHILLLACGNLIACSKKRGSSPRQASPARLAIIARSNSTHNWRAPCLPSNHWIRVANWRFHPQYFRGPIDLSHAALRMVKVLLKIWKIFSKCSLGWNHPSHICWAHELSRHLRCGVWYCEPVVMVGDSFTYGLTLAIRTGASLCFFFAYIRRDTLSVVFFSLVAKHLRITWNKGVFPLQSGTLCVIDSLEVHWGSSCAWGGPFGLNRGCLDVVSWRSVLGHALFSFQPKKEFFKCDK
jgi:hypothetical protein